MSIAGIVLAGGLSRRMEGREKSLLKLAGRPLIAHVCERLRLQVVALAINANGDPERFKEFGCEVVPDPVTGFVGPLAGILAGMKWAISSNTGVTHIVSVAADTPFFPNSLVANFSQALEAASSETIALASTGGRSHPVFGLWPVTLAQSLEEFLSIGESRKVLAFVDQHRRVDVPFDDQRRTFDPFFNINTHEDLEKAEDLMGEAMR